MHEAGLTLEVLDIACETAAGRRVSRVVLEIGRLSGILPDAVRFCFSMASEGTLVEGAELVVVETPGADFKLASLELA